MKENLIIQIVSHLSRIGISPEVGERTDLTITADFLDAGWSTGKKTIGYESAIYLDEGSQTIYMWEKTSETQQGFSFGGETASSFQMGRTLFRKVKSIQYGPDGKAFEYSLDLGAIAKAVKDVAKENHWHFKIVLNRDKALYPKDTASAQNRPLNPATQPQQSQTTIQHQGEFAIKEGTFYAKGGKATVKEGASRGGAIVFWGLEIILTLLALLIIADHFSLKKLAGFGVIVLLPIIFKRKFHGFLKSLLLWSMIFILFFIFIAITG